MFAQENKPKPNTNAIGSGWSSKTKPATGALPRKKNISTDGVNNDYKEALAKINGYFNNLKVLSGRFLQINPNKSKLSGKFFIKRPGRVRFEYARPSFQRIISDGENLSIEDLDQKTADRYPLDQTPFQMLLAKNVNLARDANIVKLTRVEKDHRLFITLKDKSGKAPGFISLVFYEQPKLNLVSWIINDAQGLQTTVNLSHHNYTKQLSRKLFVLENIEKPFALP